jgi:hypothetical protein
VKVIPIIHRKKGEDKYYTIDFGQAGINYTPDIENFIEQIEESFDLKNDLPVQHDVGYLINMCHHLKEIVSCDYDYDMKEFVDKFTEIFDREIVQPSFYNPKKSLKKKSKKKSLKKKSNKKSLKNKKSIRSPP